VRYSSVCDGIGAAHVAWQPLGWECAWTSEIEAFPSAVVDERWKLKNVGDMTKLTEEQLQHEGPISLLVGGTPCQSFSAAGLRKGLEDPRGNLALRFTQLVGVLRPTWLVWENVPGVLSSGGGRDFGTFLGALGELGYGFAYRILDAQWFGVAQRRRRVFVVAHARDWRRAAAVLFERESVFGNPPTRGAKGEKVTGPIAGCSNGGGANGPGRTADDADSLVLEEATVVRSFPLEISPALKARDFKGPSSDGDGDDASLVPITFKHNMSTPSWGVDQCETLQAKNNCAIAFAQNQLGEVRCNSEVMGTVNTNQNASGRNTPMVAIAFDGGNQSASDDIHHTLRSGRDSGDAIAFRENQRGEVQYVDPPHALASGGGKPGQGYCGVQQAMAVRRLTPRECERLQGFPDDYTLVTYRNKPAADGPRYKALGNSMAVPVMRWIGERIASVDSVSGDKA
jgi:DNA (cytosine-5)-methyltransferase 1